MLVVTRHTVADPAAFLAAVEPALAAVSSQSGCEGAEVVRAFDDPQVFLFVMRWRDVGSFRRGMGHFEVKTTAVPLLYGAEDVPSTFEVLRVGVAGEVTAFEPDLAPDADTAGPGR